MCLALDSSAAQDSTSSQRRAKCAPARSEPIAMTWERGLAADCGCRIVRGVRPQPDPSLACLHLQKKQGSCRGAARPLASVEREARARLLLRSIQCEAVRAKK